MAARVSMKQRSLGHAFNIQDPRTRKSLEKIYQLMEKSASTSEASHFTRLYPEKSADAAGRGVPTASCGLFLGGLALTVRHGPFGWPQVIRINKVCGIFNP